MTDLTSPKPEPLLTFSATAEVLGLPAFKIRPAAKAGVFPVYRIGNARALVRLTEVVDAIERSRSGGRDA